jgi:Organic solute transporter Ostalpha
MYTVLSYPDNSFSIALYGLILFYTLTKEELVGRRPLAKFLSIKLIVIFTFYQSFVVCSALSVPPVTLIYICW